MHQGTQDLDREPGLAGSGEPPGWRPPVPGPPAWFDFAGRRFYRLPTGYYAARDGRRPGRLHMAIWESVNGRTVPPGHVIHHADHDPENNHPGNLAAMEHGDHDRHHRAAIKRSAEACARIQAGVLESWARRQSRTVTCEVCGSQFETRSSRRVIRFCSTRCKGLAGKQAAAGLTRWVPSDTDCENCGQRFTPKDRRSRFCSPDCAGRRGKAVRESRRLRPDD
jgi:predicted RNA-binding Zn-ribbon protein involved in translation (DUF1610 family)